MYVRLIGEFPDSAGELFVLNEAGVKKSWRVRLYVMVRADSAAETMVHP